MHIFVAMPFGMKKREYSDLIKPALVGYERADEEQAAGNIRTDMFQELLSDLVLVDLSIDNHNSMNWVSDMRYEPEA